MQNPNVKYLKMPNGNCCLFYHENNTLFLRTHANGNWLNPNTLAEHTNQNFSICHFKDVCYLLYSTTEGDLFMASSRDLKNWDHRPMIGGAPNSGKIKFFMVPSEDAFHIIYHLPTEATGIDSLVYATFQNGKWEKPYQIDRFIPFGKTVFLARRISNEHIILYYRTSKNIWSAREMLLSPYTMGSLTPIIQTQLNYIDISIVNDNERIHIFYIVRNMFRTQVVYQYKQTSAISTPRVLWEDSNCDNCLAYLENQKLILMWTANGQPLRCISNNGGASFGAIERYTGNFPTQCTKGELLGADDLTLNATETYGDLSRNFSPFLISQSFVKTQTETPFSNFEKKEHIPSASFEPNFASHALQNDPTKQTPAFTTKTLQQNQSSIPSLNPHQQELEELSTLLAQRSEEITSVNARWMAQVSKMEDELLTLRKENEQLQQNLQLQEKNKHEITQLSITE